ncbi:hypothetical protein AVEN_199400-1, partial [Araneus ventricosus]
KTINTQPFCDRFTGLRQFPHYDCSEAEPQHGHGGYGEPNSSSGELKGAQ